MTEFLPPSAAEYYRQWLRRNRMKHGVAAVGDFVRAHSFMFGQQIGVIAGGYLRWAERSGGEDGPDAFGEYINLRYERWRAARVEARRTPVRRAVQPLRSTKSPRR